MAHTVYAVRVGQKFNADTNLTVVQCYACQMTYAIPSSLDSSARAYPGSTRNGWTICCPLGHEWHYTGRSIEQELQDAKHRTARVQASLDQTEASLRSQEAAATRARNERDKVRRRVAAGVCPCCNRRFKQLARHMKSQHPDFPEDD